MIVCADDYGLRPAVNRAILELAQAGRLSAVSCMVALEACSLPVLAELLPLGDRLDLGLHLCLTDEGQALCVDSPFGGSTLPKFGSLLRGALSGRWDRDRLRSHISVQYQRFVEKCGRTPDYIDGHLHAHQLPGIREALLEFVGALPAASRPYLRNTYLPLRELWRRRLPWLKGALIGAFGARLLAQARRGGVATNSGFAGIYDFGQWRHYPEYFPRFVDCLPQANGLLVVHPGLDEDWRRQEAEVLRRNELAPGKLNRFRTR